MNTTPHILNVKNLSMRFGGLLALKDVSFGVQKNSITALIGPNGAGKTTVFNCITGFYPITSGEISFISNKEEKEEEININKFMGNIKSNNPLSMLQNFYYQIAGGSQLLAQKGLVRTFQNVHLFSDITVLENLLVAQHNSLNNNIISGLLNTKSFRKSEKQAIEKAYHWLDILKLSHTANQLARNLPYGEQRRLEIARAMCANPSLLCLDEPAAGLNHTETTDLAEIMGTLRQKYNMTILLVEHDMSMIMKISDHIIVLDHGELLEQGNAAHIRNCPEVIRAYLGG